MTSFANILIVLYLVGLVVTIVEMTKVILRILESENFSELTRIQKFLLKESTYDEIKNMFEMLPSTTHQAVAILMTSIICGLLNPIIAAGSIKDYVSYMKSKINK